MAQQQDQVGQVLAACLRQGSRKRGAERVKRRAQGSGIRSSAVWARALAVQHAWIAGSMSSGSWHSIPMTGCSSPCLATGGATHQFKVGGEQQEGVVSREALPA